MSKKHFIKLAAALAKNKPTDAQPGMMAQWRCMVLAVVEVCQECNAQFDRARFLSACGY